MESFISRLISCNRCPRLTQYRNSFPDNYWKKPVPPNGEINAEIVIIGLAPAANGGNRTGRMFTGDESSNNLTNALYAVGFANQPFSISKDDGLKLVRIYITSAVKCAPPQNKPNKDEIINCSTFLEEEVRMLENAKVYIALGKVAWDSIINVFKKIGYSVPNVKFYHGALVKVTKPDMSIIWLIGSYHPSPRNMKTGRLTMNMLVEIFSTAKRLVSNKERIT
ncbi:MAG: uracil-DNA glycosylase [Saccharolobus sp.]|uniref:Uracil-DNA glycosylase, family 5 n=2 Tax=Saccharolobus shibatae TaxID=2286 RepID=A0A8F5GYM2_9CREN|nr:uracil-DNA glycosylase [Saccharolobus shibatae]MCH4815669.1 uracil-DNA glycosylase [Saccharolobus shibatae]QXJ27899.1 Uracil-DNA glycosylase, family 5 [Saccharolobus shibatae B12]QXJ31216.1 Uracil-DNA glycosylase, family 5 [Saccharolobus shibatae]QXJ34231.1 Uracil-DNA glycosylase, family 5 [Saccharolobus shibatae]